MTLYKWLYFEDDDSTTNQIEGCTPPLSSQNLDTFWDNNWSNVNKYKEERSQRQAQIIQKQYS